MINAEDKRKLEILIDYKKRAAAEREAGGFVQFNLMLPYIAITCSNGDDYFFQGEEAENLIHEAENALDGDINIVDYLLVISQGW
jgi:hypothetical protein